MPGILRAVDEDDVRAVELVLAAVEIIGVNHPAVLSAAVEIVAEDVLARVGVEVGRHGRLEPVTKRQIEDIKI